MPEVPPRRLEELAERESSPAEDRDDPAGEESLEEDREQHEVARAPRDAGEERGVLAAEVDDVARSEGRMVAEQVVARQRSAEVLLERGAERDRRAETERDGGHGQQKDELPVAESPEPRAEALHVRPVIECPVMRAPRRAGTRGPGARRRGRCTSRARPWRGPGPPPLPDRRTFESLRWFRVPDVPALRIDDRPGEARLVADLVAHPFGRRGKDPIEDRAVFEGDPSGRAVGPVARVSEEHTARVHLGLLGPGLGFRLRRFLRTDDPRRPRASPAPRAGRRRPPRRRPGRCVR